MIIKPLLHMIAGLVLLFSIINGNYMYGLFVLIFYGSSILTISLWNPDETIANKLSILAISLTTIVGCYAIGVYYKNRIYQRTINHNSSIIHKFLDRVGVPMPLSELKKLKYFKISRPFRHFTSKKLTTEERMHNFLLDFIYYKFFEEHIDDFYSINKMNIDHYESVSKDPELFKEFKKFRKYIKSCDIDIDPNKYENFSIFGYELLYYKCDLLLKDGEQTQLESLINSSGARSMRDIPLKVFQLLNNANEKDYASIIRAFRHQSGPIQTLASHIHKK